MAPKYMYQNGSQILNFRLSVTRIDKKVKFQIRLFVVPINSDTLSSSSIRRSKGINNMAINLEKSSSIKSGM